MTPERLALAAVVLGACCRALVVGPSRRLAPRRALASRLRSGAGEEAVFDVVVCGAGPSGLSVAAECAKRDLSVCVVDPALERPWPNNYGVWIDEVEPLGYEDCCDVVWAESSVIFEDAGAGGDLANVTLRRPYGRVDRAALKARLVAECGPRTTFLARGAAAVDHFDAAPSVVTLDGPGPPGTVRGLAVVDATGFRRKFVRHDAAVAFDPGFQVTYGALVEVPGGHPFPLDRLVLMDYRDSYLGDDAAARARNDRFPSFMYVMPMSDTRIFFEETILVSRPGGDSKDLEARLKRRLEATYGITDFEVLESERAAIPMGGADPAVPQRTVGCGSTASAIHPASGYMVARALEVAPRVAAALADHPRLSPDGRAAAAAEGRERPGALDSLAEAAWDATWPPDDRKQRDFMHFGFELLCDLSPGELRDFFAGFFRLPDALWEHFLSWRLSGAGHVYMGALVWWQCIPKRFMAPMLFKSLPYLVDKLVLPFASRGGPPLAEHTPYTEAKWRPEPYYAYLETLRTTVEDPRRSAAPEPAAPEPAAPEAVAPAAAR